MDKKLTRKIGYKRKPSPPIKVDDGKITVTKKFAKALIGSKFSKPVDIPVTPKQVIDWINAHPGFKWAWLCKQVSVNKSNFSRTIQHEDPKIRPDVLEKMVVIIKDYGFGV